MVFKWEVKKFIGQGSYGSVYLAQPAPSSSSLISSGKLPPPVAIKSASRIHSCNSLILEKTVLNELRGCPEIVHCFENEDFVSSNYLDGTKCYNIVLEYADGGTLAQLIQSVGGKLQEHEASMYTYMLLKGLSHVHKEGYVHCDVKPDNILAFKIPSDQCEGVVKHNLKLADFGLAKKAGERNYGVAGVEYKYRGTLLYNPPESVISGIHEAPMDIWALGCTLLVMLIGKEGLWRRFIGAGYEDLAELIASYEDNRLSLILPEFDNLSEYAKEFIRRCLAKNVGERWTADQLLKHPFITYNQKLLQVFEGQRCLNQIRYISQSVLQPNYLRTF